MSRFYVGCRVRVRDANTKNQWLEHLRGAELVIVDDGANEHDGEDSWYLSAVSMRGRKTGVRKFQANEFLIPILPPHEASEYTFTELMDRCRAGEGVCA